MSAYFVDVSVDELDEINGGAIIGGIAGGLAGGMIGGYVGIVAACITYYQTGDSNKAANCIVAGMMSGAAVGGAIGLIAPF